MPRALAPPRALTPRHATPATAGGELQLDQEGGVAHPVADRELDLVAFDGPKPKRPRRLHQLERAPPLPEGLVVQLCRRHRPEVPPAVARPEEAVAIGAAEQRQCCPAIRQPGQFATAVAPGRRCGVGPRR